MLKDEAMYRTYSLRLIWVAALVFLADWLTKTMVNTHLDPYVPVSIFPSFNLTLAYNTGAAFSFLDNNTLWANVMFGCIAMTVSVFIIGWLCRLPRQETQMRIGLSLILGGALGNLWDRITHQHVIDFLDFYLANWHFPVFNVADTAVSLGAILVAWKWIISNK